MDLNNNKPNTLSLQDFCIVEFQNASSVVGGTGNFTDTMDTMHEDTATIGG